jgi:hypothetical protein
MYEEAEETEELLSRKAAVTEVKAWEGLVVVAIRTHFQMIWYLVS